MGNSHASHSMVRPLRVPYTARSSSVPMAPEEKWSRKCSRSLWNHGCRKTVLASVRISGIVLHMTNAAITANLTSNSNPCAMTPRVKLTRTDYLNECVRTWDEARSYSDPQGEGAARRAVQALLDGRGPFKAPRRGTLEYTVWCQWLQRAAEVADPRS